MIDNTIQIVVQISNTSAGRGQEVPLPIVTRGRNALAHKTAVISPSGYLGITVRG